MSVQFSYDNNRLTAALKGDIDHHGAAEMRIQIDGELERTTPSLLTLDFSEVGFMDSSGIGLILGRARKVFKMGADGSIGCRCHCSTHVVCVLDAKICDRANRTCFYSGSKSFAADQRGP